MSRRAGYLHRLVALNGRQHTDDSTGILHDIGGLEIEQRCINRNEIAGRRV